MSKGRHIVVIGTSAGGLEALDEVIGQFQSGLPASVFIVQHLAPEVTGEALLQVLGRHKAFRCKLAEDGESFEDGTIYIAPADYHLLVKEKKLLVTKGARENRYRPAIDPLFRSAAVAHGSGVIGVVLTGMLDDRTAGLIAIQKCGGVAVVQDPKDAAYPEMPQSVINHMRVDHCIPLAGMGELLEKLVHEPAGKSAPVPEDIRTEAEIAERVLSDIAQINTLGSQAPYTAEASCGKWIIPTCTDSGAIRAMLSRRLPCSTARRKRSRKHSGSLSGCSKNAGTCSTTWSRNRAAPAGVKTPTLNAQRKPK